jgi:hypothetical protein
MRCPYCARPLSMLGTKCKACRRYILGWSHIIIVAVIVIIGLIVLLEAVMF